MRKTRKKREMKGSLRGRRRWLEELGGGRRRKQGREGGMGKKMKNGRRKEGGRSGQEETKKERGKEEKGHEDGRIRREEDKEE